MHARSAADVSVIRFYLTSFSNLLCELVNAKVGRKEAIRVAAIVIEFVLWLSTAMIRGSTIRERLRAVIPLTNSIDLSTSCC